MLVHNSGKLTKKQFLRVAGLSAAWVIVAGAMACGGTNGGEMEKAANIKCGECPMRARYDRNPKSLLSRLWKWHTGWCPGWKSYLASLPEEERKKVMEKYK